MSEYFRKYIKKDHFPLHPSDVKFKTYFNNCILTSLQARGWKQTDADDWNIYWCEKQYIPENLDRMRLFPNKRINHFRNWYEICRKDLLAKNIKRYKRQLEKDGNSEEAATYDFTPLTYNLPSEYSIFLEEFKRTKHAMWIMKPIGKSQGKGIFLFNKISDISEWSEMSNQPEAYIVQRYIHNPLLIGNKKFDMRLYALVTSHNPLTVYIYRSGFGRFTHTRYDGSDTSALESHLTNVAVQKNSQNYDEQRGGKYFIDKLRIYLASKHSPQKIDRCFHKIQQLIIKSLLATCKLIINDRKCFQLYGYDIMIDDNLKPWLIQINGSPSMSANTQNDSFLKTGLLDDLFTVLNIQSIVAGDQEQVGGFDLVYRDGKRLKSNYMDFNNGINPHIITKKDSSMIGCFNNRDQNIRKMAKIRALKLAEEHTRSQNSLSNPPATNPQNRNPSINNRVNQQMRTGMGTGLGMGFGVNSQRGRSLAPTQAKPNENLVTKAPQFQPNSSFSSKKAPTEEGLKLPKVTSTSVSLANSSKAIESGKNAEVRTGSRGSGR